MTRRRLLLLLAVATLAGVLALVVLSLTPDDSSRIQGAWVGDGVRLTFSGDVAELTFDRGERRHHRTYFRLDSSASPPRIVVFDPDGPGVTHPRKLFGVPVARPSAVPGGEHPGIYELRGDRLRICSSHDGTTFPTDFDPAQGAVFDLRRE